LSANELRQYHLAFVKQPLKAYLSHPNPRIIAVFDKKAGIFKAALTAVIGVGFMPKARLFALIFQTVRILYAPGRLIQPLAFCLASRSGTISLAAFGPGVGYKKLSAV
jgi:hypothetical protein